MAYLWPVIGRGTAVIKKLLLYAFPFGIGVWLCGTLFLDRQNKQDAVKQLHMQLEAIQQRKSKIVIFPEGTRKQENKILPFKKGAFHLAIDSQSMVQPVVVSCYHFLSSKEKIFGKGETFQIFRFHVWIVSDCVFSGKIIISILPAISCRGMTKSDVNGLLEKTKTLMDAHFEVISKETKL